MTVTKGKVIIIAVWALISVMSVSCGDDDVLPPAEGVTITGTSAYRYPLMLWDYTPGQIKEAESRTLIIDKTGDKNPSLTYRGEGNVIYLTYYFEGADVAMTKCDMVIASSHINDFLASLGKDFEILCKSDYDIAWLSHDGSVKAVTAALNEENCIATFSRYQP